MAKVFLKPGADPKKVSKRLRRDGFVMKQQLPDGSFVLYKNNVKQKNQNNPMTND